MSRREGGSGQRGETPARLLSFGHLRGARSFADHKVGQRHSKLLISDLDNTLFAPNGDGVIAVRSLSHTRAGLVADQMDDPPQRPFLKTFIKYITHPESPYRLAIWTFSGRQWGAAHLRQVGMGKVRPDVALWTCFARTHNHLASAVPLRLDFGTRRRRAETQGGRSRLLGVRRQRVHGLQPDGVWQALERPRPGASRIPFPWSSQRTG